ncbi:MAG: cation diffusion facilitator family transporter [Anaerolineales bacterium]|jgi:cobalt-zinc-cadmium efflux system protein
MSHQHAHPHSHKHNTSANIRTAFFLNLGFTLFEIVGAIWTNSLAILSDAVHDLGDSFSLGMAWFLERYAQKGEDQRFSYGYRRFSLLGALINAIILTLGSFFVLVRAIPRLMEPESVNAQGMVLFAVVGILVNGLAVFRLRGSKSMNAKVVAWHLLEDVLGWVAVLIVGIVLIIFDIPVLDPILSVLIALYILYNVIRNLRQTVGLFLQAVPESIEIDQIEKELHAVEHIQSTHHTHIWSLDGEHHVLTTHVVLDEAISKDDVLCVRAEMKDMLAAYDFSHITVEIEFGEDDCAMA